MHHYSKDANRLQGAPAISLSAVAEGPRLANVKQVRLLRGFTAKSPYFASEAVAAGVALLTRVRLALAAQARLVLQSTF